MNANFLLRCTKFGLVCGYWDPYLTEIEASNAKRPSAITLGLLSWTELFFQSSIYDVLSIERPYLRDRVGNKVSLV